MFVGGEGASSRSFVDGSKFGQPLALPPKAPTKRSRNQGHYKSQSMASLSQMKSKLRVDASIIQEEDETAVEDNTILVPDKGKKRSRNPINLNETSGAASTMAFSSNDILKSQQFISLKPKTQLEQKPANPLSRSTETLVLPKVAGTHAPAAMQAREHDVEMPQQITKWGHFQLNENGCVVIKPNYDASNKQIFFKNKFRTNAGNMMQFLETKGVEAMREEVFRPRYLGDMSKTVLGPIVNISCAPDNTNQDFALSYKIKQFQKAKPAKPEEGLPQIKAAGGD